MVESTTFAHLQWLRFSIYAVHCENSTTMTTATATSTHANVNRQSERSLTQQLFIIVCVCVCVGVYCQTNVESFYIFISFIRSFYLLCWLSHFQQGVHKMYVERIFISLHTNRHVRLCNRTSFLLEDDIAVRRKNKQIAWQRADLFVNALDNIFIFLQQIKTDGQSERVKKQ